MERVQSGTSIRAGECTADQRAPRPATDYYLRQIARAVLIRDRLRATAIDSITLSDGPRSGRTLAGPPLGTRSTSGSSAAWKSQIGVFCRWSLAAVRRTVGAGRRWCLVPGAGFPQAAWENFPACSGSRLFW